MSLRGVDPANLRNGGPTATLPDRGLSVKLYALEETAVRLEEIIPVFHRWIQADVLSPHLPIDVGDYGHVHRGPGVILACHTGIFGFEAGAGGVGLRYRRNRPTHVADALCDALHAAATACIALQEEEALRGRLQFGTDQVLLRVDNRLWSTTGVASLEGLRRHVATIAPVAFGDAAAVDVEASGSTGGPGGPIRALLRITNGPDLRELRKRTSAAVLNR